MSANPKTSLSSTVFLIVLGIAALYVGAIEGLLLHRNGWTLFYAAVFPMIIGAGNTVFAERNRMNRKLRKANEEIEHLAKSGRARTHCA